ncbi:MAG: hypothetical protein QGF00_03215, partial [Planctomycetota bacterium]|nr:hypothetical protein [Planctomycetota bacterium]
WLLFFRDVRNASLHMTDGDHSPVTQLAVKVAVCILRSSAFLNALLDIVSPPGGAGLKMK